jgi:phosphofructokinase-like protein
MKRIGVMTGGGDCPGLNAVIRSVVVKASTLGCEVIGFRRGWKGLLDAGEIMRLEIEDVEDIHMLGGTIIGTSRTNPQKVENGLEQVERNLQKHECVALIAIGGEDTLGVAKTLSDRGMKIVGVPKTIDNDLSATDYTFGFDTAINIATEALDRLHTTAKSHERILVVEIMGRHAGWMALHAGMAGGAHIILIPEVPFDIDWICRLVKERKEKGKDYTLVAVSEGAIPTDLGSYVTKDGRKDDYERVKLGGIADHLARMIEERTGLESRSVVLGHLQRGGSPTTFDRVLGTRLGIKAVEMVHNGEFGKMASVRGTEIISVPLAEAVGVLKTVPPERYDEAKIFFG